MSPETSSFPDYRSNYLQRLCDQNHKIFTSTFVWNFKPDELPLNPRRKFPQCNRTFLEIGFGHGEVLEELVHRYPETGFVGIERRPARVRKALRRLTRTGTSNAQLVRINLELCRDGLFSTGSFDEILVNHPDPWHKKRHEHHRFFQPETVDWLASLLIKDGSVEVASDHAEYFFQILRFFEENANFESLLPPPFYTNEAIAGRAMSRFERKKRNAGKTVRILKFVRK